MPHWGNHNQNRCNVNTFIEHGRAQLISRNENLLVSFAELGNQIVAFTGA